MGVVLHCLVSKCLPTAVRSVAVKSLSSLQLGVAVKSGRKTLVHSVSRVMQDPTLNSWALLIDFSNAFNAMDRGAVLKDLRARISSLAPQMIWLQP